MRFINHWILNSVSWFSSCWLMLNLCLCSLSFAAQQCHMWKRTKFLSSRTVHRDYYKAIVCFATANTSWKTVLVFFYSRDYTAFYNSDKHLPPQTRNPTIFTQIFRVSWILGWLRNYCIVLAKKWPSLDANKHTYLHMIYVLYDKTYNVRMKKMKTLSRKQCVFTNPECLVWAE